MVTDRVVITFPAHFSRESLFRRAPVSMYINEGHTSRKDRQRISDPVLKALFAFFFGANLNNRANILPYDTSHFPTLEVTGSRPMR